MTATFRPTDPVAYDVMAFLETELPGHCRGADDTALTNFIQSESTTPNSGAPSLRALLRAVATKSPAIPVEACSALLTAIDSSVTSIEEQHP